MYIYVFVYTPDTTVTQEVRGRYRGLCWNCSISLMASIPKEMLRYSLAMCHTCLCMCIHIACPQVHICSHEHEHAHVLYYVHVHVHENCEGWLSPGGHSSGGRALMAKVRGPWFNPGWLPVFHGSLKIFPSPSSCTCTLTCMRVQSA